MEKRYTETEMGGLREDRFGGSGEKNESGGWGCGDGWWRRVVETAVILDQ